MLMLEFVHRGFSWLDVHHSVYKKLSLIGKIYQTIPLLFNPGPGQFNVPFKIISVHMRRANQWVGRKRENPEKNHLAHPQAELGLPHMWPGRGTRKNVCIYVLCSPGIRTYS